MFHVTLVLLLQFLFLIFILNRPKEYLVLLNVQNTDKVIFQYIVQDSFLYMNNLVLPGIFLLPNSDSKPFTSHKI